jgi:hypothetical protein
MVTVAAWFWVASAVAAPRVQIALTTDRIEVGQGVVAQVVVVGEAAKGVPQIPAPEGVAVQYRSRSDRFEIVGGRATSIYAYQYVVEALAEGDWTLGPVVVETSGGQKVDAGTLQLRVMPSQSVEPEAAAIEVFGGFDVAEAWEGQVVSYDYEARARGRVVDIRWRFPEFEGLRVPQQQVGGRTEEFQILDPGGAITVSQGVLPLIATATGTRAYGSALVEVGMRSGRPGFASIFDTRTQRMPTEPSSLSVRARPPAPEGFTGLVGEFVFESSLDKQRAAVGESVTWRLQVAGDGTLEGFVWEPLTIQGATVYTGDTDRAERVEDGAYRAFAITDNVLVPSQPGSLEIPPLELITFSPSKGEYVPHVVTVPSLAVTGAADGSSVTVESFASEPEPLVEGDGIDFRGIYRWGLSSTPFLGAAVPVLSGLAALPGAGVLGLLGLQWLRSRRRRAAEVEVTLTAAMVLAELPPERGEAQWSVLDAALRLALAARVGVSVGELERDAAIACLPEELGAAVRDVFGALDRARFAGLPPAADPVAAVRAVITELEAL